MKASELIKRLQELVEEHGDLVISSPARDEYNYPSYAYKCSITNTIAID